MPFDLLRRANDLFRQLPIYLQCEVDAAEDSGLEPEELPDAYERMFGRDKDDEKHG